MNTHDDTVRRIAKLTGIPASIVRDVLAGLERVALEDIYKTGEFRLRNIVTIKHRVIPERSSRDPMTGEIKQYPEVKALVAKSSTNLIKAYRDSQA